MRTIKIWIEKNLIDFGTMIFLFKYSDLKLLIDPVLTGIGIVVGNTIIIPLVIKFFDWCKMKKKESLEKLKEKTPDFIDQIIDEIDIKIDEGLEQSKDQVIDYIKNYKKDGD